MKTIDKRITDDETINEFLKKLFDLGIPFLIGIGGVTVVVSFFVFFGAIKESKCMLGIYIGLNSANVTLEAMYYNKSMDVNFNEK